MTKERRILLMTEASAREKYLETLGIDPSTYGETEDMQKLRCRVVDAIMQCDDAETLDAAVDILYWDEIYINKPYYEDVLSLKLKAIRFALRTDVVKELFAVDALLRDELSTDTVYEPFEGFVYEECPKRNNTKDIKAFMDIDECLRANMVMLAPAI